MKKHAELSDQGKTRSTVRKKRTGRLNQAADFGRESISYETNSPLRLNPLEGTCFRIERQPAGWLAAVEG